MDSESSYIVPPSRIEIFPHLGGEVEIGRYRAVFRGDIEIRCSYSDSHRVVLPRRSTVQAVYIMHIPVGYELRRIPSSTPIRYAPSTIPSISLSGSSRALRSRVEPPRPGPGATTRQSAEGTRVSLVSRTQMPGGAPDCQCLTCRSTRVSFPSPPTTKVREVQEYTPGPSSHRVCGRTVENGVDTRGPVHRARLSPPPSYSPAPVAPMVRDGVICISSDEEDSE